MSDHILNRKRGKGIGQAPTVPFDGTGLMNQRLPIDPPLKSPRYPLPPTQNCHQGKQTLYVGLKGRNSHQNCTEARNSETFGKMHVNVAIQAG